VEPPEQLLLAALRGACGAAARRSQAATSHPPRLMSRAYRASGPAPGYGRGGVCENGSFV
jgi:hypothetical protein